MTSYVARSLADTACNKSRSSPDGSISMDYATCSSEAKGKENGRKALPLLPFEEVEVPKGYRQVSRSELYHGLARSGAKALARRTHTSGPISRLQRKPKPLLPSIDIALHFSVFEGYLCCVLLRRVLSILCTQGKQTRLLQSGNIEAWLRRYEKLTGLLSTFMAGA